MILPVPPTINTVPVPTMTQRGGLYEFAKRLPPTKEPVHPPPTRETRDLFKWTAKHGGKAFSKYAPKAKDHFSKHPGAAKTVVKGFALKSWMMWLGAGIVIVVVLLLIRLVWKKRDYKWRRAELEAEAKAMFEGNNDDDIDPSTIPFGQPWSHRAIAERRAEAERRAAEGESQQTV